MIARHLIGTVRSSLQQFPAVGLVGPRQVGKTTLALELARSLPGKSVYLDLERPGDLLQLRDVETFVRIHRDELIILDEIQVRTDLFPHFRSLIDAHRVPGRFLFLGSASGELLHHSSESLAGRIIYHELPPLLASEIGGDASTRDRLWLRGGFPPSFLAADDAQSLLWRDAFFRTYLERDLPQLGVHTPAGQLRRFCMMLAHFHGQLWNGSRLAASMDVTSPTIAHYLSVLEDAFLVRRLRPFHANLGKRLVKAPKVYLRDAGLLHLLLNISTVDHLLAHPSLGESWEGFVIEQVIGQLPPFWDYYYYRTHTGDEIDLLLVPPGGGRPIAVEIKFSSSPTVSAGLYRAMADLKCQHGYVLCPVGQRFALDANLDVLPVEQIPTLFARV